MTILVVGATGATGRLLVENLLGRGLKVKAIVRSPEKLPKNVKKDDNLSLIIASLLKLSDEEMAQHVKGCNVVASCLGHNLSLGGIFGPPYRLVTNATRRLCDAIISTDPQEPVRFVLMNTTSNRNDDIPEKVSLAEKLVTGLIRILLPPQIDNEKAADHLRVSIGKDDEQIEWVVVRPDTLIDENEVSEYKVFPSPIRSAIFDAGKTSRINVGDFMANLITDDDLWKKWRGQMPVIYNIESI